MENEGRRVMESENGLCDTKVVDSVHQENSLDGAHWDIFWRVDVPKLNHFGEFRHIYCSPLKHVRSDMQIRDLNFLLTFSFIFCCFLS
jgi:hypothetical protein